ncbi:MAG: hypothetical protein K2O95_03215, partial [Clostridia bacterium]|nr:hypothetical protein [Clostridia bacterium]
DPNDPTNPNYPQTDPDDPNSSGDPSTDPDDKNGIVDFDKIGQVLKEWWQVIASVISIILIIIFTSKGIGYANKRKENKRAIESKYNTFYAVSGTGLFGLSMTNWTIIACVLMGLAVLSFVFMLIEKRGYKKSQRDLEDAKDEFIRNKEELAERKRTEEKEDMKMMFMHMMGGNSNGNGQQGGYAYAGQGLGADEIRGIVSETMTAMLPNFQQYLPQQASNNEELVEKLLAKTEKNEETIQKLMKKIAEQPTERVVEREVASANLNDEMLEKLANIMQSSSNVNKKTLEQIINKLQPIASDETILKVVNQTEQNDETIRRILDNQEKLMEKILELSANQPSGEAQVIEKIVEVPVEKIVEKEVVKEVPIEVEKVVEKIVEIPAAKPAPKAKVVAPRLTLDEAYAKLSAKQKKIFDTLKAYALSKDKCKEKKSTYSILLGQSSVNPLVKLTIKKDTTVALFKMEDEYFKDIRRNATNDGTKVKVKETELVVGDAQALATAKEMVDLREDQIERYNEYRKEQRSMKK